MSLLLCVQKIGIGIIKSITLWRAMNLPQIRCMQPGHFQQWLRSRRSWGHGPPTWSCVQSRVESLTGPHPGGKKSVNIFLYSDVIKVALLHNISSFVYFYMKYMLYMQIAPTWLYWIDLIHPLLITASQNFEHINLCNYAKIENYRF